jgi:hypothetical protein
MLLFLMKRERRLEARESKTDFNKATGLPHGAAKQNFDV